MNLQFADSIQLRITVLVRNAHPVAGNLNALFRDRNTCDLYIRQCPRPLFRVAGRYPILAISEVIAGVEVSKQQSLAF